MPLTHEHRHQQPTQAFQRNGVETVFIDRSSEDVQAVLDVIGSVRPDINLDWLNQEVNIARIATTQGLAKVFDLEYLPPEKLDRAYHRPDHGGNADDFLRRRFTSKFNDKGRGDSPPLTRAQAESLVSVIVNEAKASNPTKEYSDLVDSHMRQPIIDVRDEVNQLT